MIQQWIWSCGGMILTGENRRTRRKTCPSATLSNTNPTRTGLRANAGLRCEMPATNRTATGLFYWRKWLRAESDAKDMMVIHICRWVVSFKRGRFTPVKRTPVPTGYAAGWAPELIWTLWRRKTCPARNRTPLVPPEPGHDSGWALPCPWSRPLIRPPSA
jgi:hypothetical protein